MSKLDDFLQRLLVLGLLYNREFENDECTFNENIEPHNYNTYTSTKYSNGRRTLYLALNRRGQPRRVLLRAHQPQGNVTTYIRVLTRAVSQERLDNLLHPVRHHTRCSSTTLQSKGRLPTLTTDRPTDPSRCGRRRKRKKKRRKCQTANGENDTELCHKRRTTSNHRKLQPNRLVKKCENENSDECQRDVTVKKKKQKTNIGDNKLLSGPKKKKNAKKGGKKRHQVITSTEVATTAADDVTHDEDYGLDSTTHWEWEDSTAIPDMSMSISMSMPGAPTSAQPD
ncbi:FGF domain containing protein [Asbolus verrucosus]|uniref:FGF domain containing protein n=1 Tax=Asbolus verrucosus TaxID=1661398 RepID=A0A482VRL2_ASBVE|nr:FGF domain containing protein [Asbolus verrucosus]